MNFKNIISKNISSLALDPVVNFGKVTVSTGYTTETTITLNSGEGAKLPDPSVDGSFNLVWYNSSDYPDPSDDPNVEIVRCIARSTDTLVIMRNEEGTSSSNKNTPGKTYKMILAPTKRTITDIQTDISASVQKSGDTMTGTLNLPTNGLIVGTNQLVTSGGNVGIGMINPTATLTIKGSGTGIIQMTQNPNFLNYGLISLNGTADNTNYNITSSPTDKNLYFNRPTGNAIIFRENNVGSPSQMTITTGGNIGIGVDSPGARLEISGTSPQELYVTETTNNVRTKIVARDGYGWIGTHTGHDLYIGTNNAYKIFIQNSTGNVGIGTSVPESKLTIDNGHTFIRSGYGIYFRPSINDWDFSIKAYGTPPNAKLGFYSSTSEIITMLQSGNVGIGTTNPLHRFEIKHPSSHTEMSINTIATNFVSNLFFRNNDSTMWTFSSRPLSDNYRMDIYDATSFRITILQGGNVGIGTPSPGWLLHVNGAAAKPGGGSWTDSSDIRLKKNINPMQSPLSKLLQLKGITFEWDEEERSKLLPGTQIGMIAQDVEKVFPQWVSTNDKGYKDLTFRGFEALAVEAIKELKTENDMLKDEIALLRKEIVDLRQELSQSLN